MIKTFLSVVAVTFVSAGSTEVADLISAARNEDRNMALECAFKCTAAFHKRCRSLKKRTTRTRQPTTKQKPSVEKQEELLAIPF